MASLRIGLAAVALTSAATLAARAGDALPAYVPGRSVAGAIRVWGSPADGVLLQEWEAGFRKFHPGARVSATLHGPESTMAGIYTDVADLALLARELRVPLERMAFQWVKLREPFTVEVANAGVRTDRPAACLAVFVHRDNPLTGLSLAQLDGIFGTEHRRGGGTVRTWGGLGLGGEWRNRSVHAYGPRIDDVAALFFRHAVLGESDKWNPDLVELEAGRQLFAALACDPGGIAYGPLAAVDGAVKAVPLAATGGGLFVPLTAESVADRSYPLARVVTMALDRAPGRPIEPRVLELLRFILSAEGQAAVARDGAYVPLSASSAREQLGRLD